MLEKKTHHRNIPKHILRITIPPNILFLSFPKLGGRYFRFGFSYLKKTWPIFSKNFYRTFYRAHNLKF